MCGAPRARVRARNDITRYVYAINGLTFVEGANLRPPISIPRGEKRRGRKGARHAAAAQGLNQFARFPGTIKFAAVSNFKIQFRSARWRGGEGRGKKRGGGRERAKARGFSRVRGNISHIGMRHAITSIFQKPGTNCSRFRLRTSLVSMSPRPFKIPRAAHPDAIQDFDSHRSTPLSGNQYAPDIHPPVPRQEGGAPGVAGRTAPPRDSLTIIVCPGCFSFSRRSRVYLRDRTRKQPAFCFFYHEFLDSASARPSARRPPAPRSARSRMEIQIELEFFAGVF